MLFNASFLPLLELFSTGGLAPPTEYLAVMPARLSASGFHEGETAVREMLKVPRGINPTSPGLPTPYAMRVLESPLVALGTLDAQGQPWTTIWGGERGFASPVANGILGFNSGVDTQHDPVYRALWAETNGTGGIIRPNGGQGKMMSALSIDLETRDRVKVAGMMMAGSSDLVNRNVQMAMIVTESMGNCPKYLNKKRVSRHDVSEASVVSTGLPLSPEAVQLLENSDMFFLSSTNGDSMDTNHRGGPVGFMRVVSNEADRVVLVYPEYSGNRLYQTLGNLQVRPSVGLVIPNFITGDVLYLTGSTSILVGKEAASVIARTNLAVKITISDSKLVKGGLPFRGNVMDFSPYNPPVRYLLSEKNTQPLDRYLQRQISANLIKREVLTPTINRFTFTLETDDKDAKLEWNAGQYLTMDFEKELYMGYSHMNERDPQSLNEDFIRTFTVSSPPLSGLGGGSTRGPVQVELTLRKNGRATNFLWKHNIRAPVELGVLGFGGEDRFRLPTTAADAASVHPVFVAGGVGITPLLAQAKDVLAAGVPLQVLWSLPKYDVQLAIDSFQRIEGLAAVTTLYITGGELDPAAQEELQKLGVKATEIRRVSRDDVDGLKGVTGRRFYLCAGPRLLKAMQVWLDDEDIVVEDFGY